MMSLTLDILIFATGYTHVFLAPYTKVEESFNLHATHDVVMYGVGPSNLHRYDHFVFPGAVPRTFIGSVLLGWLATPVMQLANLSGLFLSKPELQIIVRLLLATLNALSLSLLRRAVSTRFGRPTSMWYTLLTISQFHVPFWMGRTLPNMFAMFPVNLALYFLLNRAPNKSKPSQKSFNTAISLLVFALTIFRAELLLLLGPIALQGLILGHTSLKNLVKIGLISGILSLALTVSVDSYFWKRWPLWPEFSGIYFNVYQGKSSEWGTSPPLTYLTNHLPKLLLASLPLSLLSALLSSRIRSLLLPAGIFVGLISCLGHKEWRFVVYVVPMENIGGAWGLRWMASRRKGTLFGRLAFLAAIGCIIANFLATILLTRSSMANYPGGEALAQMNQKYTKKDHVHVHISNLAAQTGASLFLQAHSPPYTSILASPSSSHWTYNKTESLSPSLLTFSPQITHLIVESDADARFFIRNEWVLVDSVRGFEGWRMPTQEAAKKFWRGGILEEKEHWIWDLVPRMESREKLWILERKGWAG